MTKELEAFEELKRQVGNMPYTSYDNGLGNRTTFLIKDSAIFPIIENALKEHELMKDIRITARFDLAQVNKEHKALEIIKKKEVNVEIFNSCPNLYEYNNWATQLTQEEYDLLKEVLL